jgi:integrase
LTFALTFQLWRGNLPLGIRRQFGRFRAMPRSPKYIRIIQGSDGPRRVEKGGREVHGLHYRRTTAKGKKGRHAPSERGIYFKRVNGRRVDLGSDLAKALKAITSRPQTFDPFEANSGLGYIADAVDARWEKMVRTDAPTLAQTLGSPTAQPDIERMQRALQSGGIQPSKQKLSDCARYWQEWKGEQGRRASYVAESVRCFNEFIKVVGDKPLNQLTKADFVQFERYLNRIAPGHNGNDWYNRRVKSLRTILNHIYRKTEYPLPDAWKKWFEDVEKLPTASVSKIKRGLPPDLLKAVLRVCDKDANLDLEAMPKATQADKARRLQAAERKRAGVQWRALLTLSVNCGLGNQDICDIEWKHVKLTNKVPHLDFPRSKADWRTGTAVDRKTPLLPVTVNALRKWRAYEPPNQFIFRNARRDKWIYDDISAGFRKLLERSGFDDGQTWSFRNIRKSPGSAARDAGLPDWMVQAVLGHVADTVAARHYIEDPKPEHLREIVQAIAAFYVD